MILLEILCDYREQYNRLEIHQISLNSVVGSVLEVQRGAGMRLPKRKRLLELSELPLFPLLTSL